MSLSFPHIFKGVFLKRESRSDILEFLGDFGGRSVQIVGDAFLLAQFQRVVLFAQIAVDHVFHGEIVRTIREMISAANRRMISAQMHLQMLEEIVIFVRGERNQHADAAAEGGVYERFRASRDESGLLQGTHNFAHVEVNHHFRFFRGAAENALRGGLGEEERLESSAGKYGQSSLPSSKG